LKTSAGPPKRVAPVGLARFATTNYRINKLAGRSIKQKVFLVFYFYFYFDTLLKKIVMCHNIKSMKKKQEYEETKE
jgi:hypothetical protein